MFVRGPAVTLDNVVVPDVLTAYDTAPVIAPFIIELFTLTIAFSFVTVAIVVLPPTVTLLKLSAVASSPSSNPDLLFRLIVSALSPATPFIFTVPFVAPRFSDTVYTAPSSFAVKFFTVFVASLFTSLSVSPRVSFSSVLWFITVNTSLFPETSSDFAVCVSSQRS